MSTYSAPQNPSKAGSRSTPRGSSSPASSPPGANAASSANAAMNDGITSGSGQQQAGHPAAGQVGPGHQPGQGGPEHGRGGGHRDPEGQGPGQRPQGGRPRSRRPASRPRSAPGRPGRPGGWRTGRRPAPRARPGAPGPAGGQPAGRRAGRRRSDAVEATGPDQLHRALQAAAEGVDVVVGGAQAGQRRQPGGGRDAGDQRVLEGLVAEVALGLLGEQEARGSGWPPRSCRCRPARWPSTGSPGPRRRRRRSGGCGSGCRGSPAGSGSCSSG